MKANSPPTLLFDLDGTLLDTIGDLAESLFAVRDAFGLPRTDLGFVRRGVGNGLDALLRHGFADLEGVDLSREADIAPIRERWRAHYRDHVCVHTRPYARVVDTLPILAARGHAMAIVSNKPESFCRQLVSAVGWDDWFRVVIGGDTTASRKPDPAPVIAACARLGVDVADAWMIGDSPSDIRAGARAGCAQRVACTWGYRSRAALASEQPTRTFDDFEQLFACLLGPAANG